MSGRNSEAPAPAAQQDKTVGRTELKKAALGFRNWNAGNGSDRLAWGHAFGMVGVAIGTRSLLGYYWRARGDSNL
jgi:hypothetical protein